MRRKHAAGMGGAAGRGRIGDRRGIGSLAGAAGRWVRRVAEAGAPGRTGARRPAAVLALAILAAGADAAPDASLRPFPRPAEGVEVPGWGAASGPEAASRPAAAPEPTGRPADPSPATLPSTGPGPTFGLDPQAAPGPQAAADPQAAAGSLFVLDPGAGTGAEGFLDPVATSRPAAGLFVVLGPPDPASPVLTASIRPEARPDDILERARAARAALASPARVALPDASVRRATGALGAVCGSPAIVGEPLAAIPGRLGGCGVARPVRVRSVGGVRLSTPATMDCGTARALASWVEGSVRPAVGARGGGLEGLQVAAHYICRTRNNRPGAKISEHGRGRAIDISALMLADGSRITVLRGWRRRGAGAILRAIHAGACGPFGTVLGPDGDRHHQDHFHLDTTPRRRAICR